MDFFMSMDYDDHFVLFLVANFMVSELIVSIIYFV
jgi:hypothetical protein